VLTMFWACIDAGAAISMNAKDARVIIFFIMNNSVCFCRSYTILGVSLEWARLLR
jgi:hypothetical protein